MTGLTTSASGSPYSTPCSLCLCRGTTVLVKLRHEGARTDAGLPRIVRIEEHITSGRGAPPPLSLLTCSCSSAVADALVLLPPADADASKGQTTAISGASSFQLKI
jgi:hypothetical protein